MVTISGSAGPDYYLGTQTPDSIAGNNGNDTIYGQRGNDSLSGGGGDDLIFGNLDNDLVIGDAGNDTLNGNGGNDTLLGGSGNDSLFGGSEDDMLYGDDGNDRLDGGTGIDSINYRQYTTALTVTAATVSGDGIITDGVYTDSYHQIERVLLGSGNDTFNGNSANDGVSGGAGDDLLNGAGGDDTFFVRFGDGNDTINGGTGTNDKIVFETNSASVVWSNVANVEIVDAGVFTNTQIKGTAGDDSLDFSGVTIIGAAKIVAAGGNDTVTGSANGDNIDGGTGTDVIDGGAGADVIEGGAGADTLTGGADNDTFSYRSASQSGRTTSDHITDFASGDLIDLSGIDANSTTVGDDAFTFIGSAAFGSIAGELRVVQVFAPLGSEDLGSASVAPPSYTLIQGDTNGDGTADFQIILDNGYGINVGDFTL